MYCFCSYNPCYRYQLATFRTHHHPNCHCSWFAPTFESSTWREPSLRFCFEFSTNFLFFTLNSGCVSSFSRHVQSCCRYWCYFCARCVSSSPIELSILYMKIISSIQGLLVLSHVAHNSLSINQRMMIAQQESKNERESPTRDTSESSNENFSMILRERVNNDYANEFATE